jgi:hypothetical protein
MPFFRGAKDDDSGQGFARSPLPGHGDPQRLAAVGELHHEVYSVYPPFIRVETVGFSVLLRV